jgi:hypothetical protein
MTVLFISVATFALGIGVANATSIRRPGPHHVVARFALGGRGLFFLSTPDGHWVRLRLRPRPCRTGDDDRLDDGDGGGTREPRTPGPTGPSPLELGLTPPR